MRARQWRRSRSPSSRSPRRRHSRLRPHARRLAAARRRASAGARRDQCHRRSRNAAVITPVSLDHQEFLGDTVDKIADEKAGILKTRRAGDHRLPARRGRAVLEREARRVGAPLIVAGRDFHMPEENGRLVYRGRARPARSAAAAARRPPPASKRRRRDRRAARCRARMSAPRRSRRADARRMAGAAAAPDAGRIVDLAPRRRRSLARRRPQRGCRPRSGRGDGGIHDKRRARCVLICGAQTTKDIRALLQAFRRTGASRSSRCRSRASIRAGRPRTSRASPGRGGRRGGAGVEEALALLRRAVRRAAARARSPVRSTSPPRCWRPTARWWISARNEQHQNPRPSFRGKNAARHPVREAGVCHATTSLPSPPQSKRCRLAWA